MNETRARIDDLCERLSGHVNGSGDMDCVLEAIGELAYLSHCYRAAMMENARLRASEAHRDKKQAHGCTDAYCAICDGGKS